MEEAPAAESSSTATNKGRPPTGTRKKRRAKDPVEHTDEVDGEAQPAPAKKKRAAPRKKTADGVVDGDGSAEPAKKRPRKKATPQRSQREQSGSAEVDSDDEDLGDFSAEGPGPDASRAARKRKRYTVIANDAVDDPDAIEPGQALGPAIDEAEWTMADIAMHPGEGRVSKRGLELQKKKAEMLKEKKEKERERLLRLESLAEEGGDGAGPEEVEEIGDVNTDGGTTNATPAPAAPPVDFFNAPAIGEIGGPQLRVVNGELVIDQESLVIDQRARALAAADSMEVITETDQDRFVNASSYQRKPKGARWTAEETELFLQVSVGRAYPRLAAD
jgi:transcription factor TFIIIB component B''